MHDGMLYDTIQGQGTGHELLKVVNSAIFKAYRGRFLIFVLVFVSCDFEVGSK